MVSIDAIALNWHEEAGYSVDKPIVWLDGDITFSSDDLGFTFTIEIERFFLGRFLINDGDYKALTERSQARCKHAIERLRDFIRVYEDGTYVGYEVICFEWALCFEKEQQASIVADLLKALSTVELTAENTTMVRPNWTIDVGARPEEHVFKLDAYPDYAVVFKEKPESKMIDHFRMSLYDIFYKGKVESGLWRVVIPTNPDKNIANPKHPINRILDLASQFAEGELTAYHVMEN